ncbi:MAG: PQQ-dependent sugar dehydrogenase [Chloroflexota bacterium]
MVLPVVVFLVLALTILTAASRAAGQAPVETYSVYLPAQTVPFFGIGLDLYTTGLEEPVGIVNAGDGRLFALEREGRIRVIDDAGNLLPEPFLDIRDQVRTDFWEQGLLGLAFAPDYAESGRFYVYYSLDGTDDEYPPSRLSRFKVNPDNPNQALSDSEQPLLTVLQPHEQHKAGDLHFGPDGYLYVGLGDGGQEAAAQDTAELRGSILRLDVSTPDGEPYAIPADNPYVNTPGAMGEIWVDGLRNPWRFSFDTRSSVYRRCRLRPVGGDQRCPSGPERSELRLVVYGRLRGARHHF